MDKAIDLSPHGLTPQQKSAIQAALSGDYRWLLWVGAIRSGKSIGLAFALSIMAVQSRQACGVASPTIEVSVRNLQDYFQAAAKALGVSYQHKRGVFLIDGVPIYIFGAKNSDSHEHTRGLSARAIWIDECAHADERFVWTAMDRCSGRDGIVLLSTNASGPENFIKRKFIDSQMPKMFYLESRLEDNHHIDEERKKDYYANQSDVSEKARNLENRWAAALALVVPLRPEHLFADPPDNIYRYLIGLDPGAAGITGAVLLGQTTDQRLWALREYRYDGARADRLSSREHIERIRKLWPEARKARWVIDSAATDAVIEAQRQRLLVALSEKGRADGFRNINNRLSNGELVVHNSLRELRIEASALEWNPITDEPKTNASDHLLDALSYATRHALPVGKRIRDEARPA